MSTLVSRIFNWAIPSSVAERGVDDIRRARVVLAMSALMAFFSLSMGVVMFQKGVVSSALIGFSASFACLAIGPLMRWTGGVIFPARLMCSSFLLGLGYICIAKAGFGGSGPFLLTGILAPSAIAMLGRKEGLLWASAAAAWSVLVFVVNPTGGEYILEMGPESMAVVSFASTLVISTVMLGIGWTYESFNERALAETGLLQRIASVSAQADSFSQALEHALGIICAGQKWQVGHAFIVEARPAEGLRLRSLDIWNFQHPSDFRALRDATQGEAFDVGVGLPARAFASGQPVWVETLASNPDDPRAGICRELGIKGAFALPLVSKGQIIAVLEFFSRENMFLDSQLRSIMHNVADQLSRVFERRRTDQSVRRLQSALDGATTPFLMLDRDLVLTYINDSSLALIAKYTGEIRRVYPGFRSEGLLGKPVAEIVPDASQLRGILDSPEGLPYVGVVEIGDLRFRVHVTAISNDKGARLGNCVEWSDVTQQIHAETEVAALVDHALKGRLDRRIDTSGAEGFLESLGDRFNALLDVIVAPVHELTLVMAALADGDLSRGVEGVFRGEFRQLQERITAAIQTLRGILSLIIDTATQVDVASKQISESAESLTERIDSQASSLQETSSSCIEVTETVKQNADRAVRANELARVARERAIQGGTVSGQVVEAMSKLRQSSTEIEQSLSMIDSIAFQTNLLALNAAVEAARAGEQGRGFAVVATEVRALAERSSTAAKEIKKLIDESAARLGSTTELVGKSQESLSEIVDAVRTVSQIVAEITTASQEQAISLESISQAVAQMDTLTEQNATAVRETAVSAKQLRDQAGDLVQRVGFFDLGDS